MTEVSQSQLEQPTTLVAKSILYRHIISVIHSIDYIEDYIICVNVVALTNEPLVVRFNSF